MSTKNHTPAKSQPQPQSRRRKLCFVTVGATAPFNELVSATLDIPFLLELAAHNYTHVRIQYGRGAETHFKATLNASKESYKLLKRGGDDTSESLPGSIQVSGFDLATDAERLRDEIRATQASPHNPLASSATIHDTDKSHQKTEAISEKHEESDEEVEEGLFISHAGTGSLLDGLAFGIPMILVPNTSLADDHQQELARRFEDMHYCVRGSVEHLPDAVGRAEEWRREMRKPVRERWKTATTTAKGGTGARVVEHGSSVGHVKRHKVRGRTLQDHMDQEIGYVQVE